MMTALAALEAKVVEPQKTFFCPGFLKLGNATFHCWKRSGHGHVDMFEAIKQSCDVYFYNVAMAAGIDAIAQMATRFGLGDRSSLGLMGEKPGLIPTSAWKLVQTGEPWQTGETLIAGIGQGYVTATALQLAVMTARVVNGGVRVKPTLLRTTDSLDYVADEPNNNKHSLSIDPRWLELMKAAMAAVVNDPRGTAYKARILEPGMEMGGKTGTAQVRRITMAQRRKGLPKAADVPWAERDHALFVGFAPVNQPAFSMVVIVEHGGGGASVAAPIARDVLLEAQRRNRAIEFVIPQAISRVRVHSRVRRQSPNDHENRVGPSHGADGECVCSDQARGTYGYGSADGEIRCGRRRRARLGRRVQYYHW